MHGWWCPVSRAQGWDTRLQLTVDAETKHALEVARLADHIPATARIRAMISIWQPTLTSATA